MDIEAIVQRLETYIDGQAWAAFVAAYNSLLKLTDYPDVVFIASVSLYVALLGVALKLSRLLSEQKAWQLSVVRVAGGLVSLCLFLAILGCIAGGLVAWWAGSRLARPEHFDLFKTWLDYRSGQLPWAVGAGVIGALLGIYAIGRWVEPWFSSVLHSATLKAGLESGMQDVRDVEKTVPKQLDFDPTKHFAAAAKQNAMFLGLDVNKKPVLVSRDEWKKSHLQVVGLSRVGKGVQAAMVLCQSVLAGDAVYVFDPKGDDFAPRVLRDACQKSGKPFIYINLNKKQPPQFNVFSGADSEDIEELLEAGFELSPKGGDSDYYRTLERAAAKKLARSGADTLPGLYDASFSILGEDADKVAGFLLNLSEVSELSCVQSREGAFLGSIIDSGGVIYIVGSESVVPVVRLQKMVAYRVIQLLRQRERRGVHATVFLDEFKFMISGPVFRSFGTILGAGRANYIIAHQALGDLEDVPGDLDKNAVKKAVLVNTRLKWVYGTRDEETVKWAVALEGTKIAQKARMTADRNAQLAETVSSQRTSELYETTYIHPNQIKHLPKNTALVVGLGIAQFARTSPVKTDPKSILEVVPAPPVSRVAAESLLPPDRIEDEPPDHFDLMPPARDGDL